MRKSFRSVLLFGTMMTLAIGLVTSVFQAPTASANPPESSYEWSNISQGSDHACGLSSGVAYCWGTNYFGELGNGTKILQKYPTPVNVSGALAGKTLLSIKASEGNESTCALTSEHKLYCWGANSLGQLGNGTTTDSSVPVAVSTSGALSGKNISDYSLGDGYTCALSSDGAVFCWGNNVLSPTALNMSGVLNGLTVTSISAARQFACAVASNARAYCWGDATSGRLGNGATSGVSANPVAVSTSGVMSGKNIVQVTTGSAHACAIDTAGAMYCWGSNNDGELGVGSASPSNSSLPVTFGLMGALTGKTVQSVSVGSRQTCVIASDSRAYCVARNDSGQLGNGSLIASLTPTAVSTSGELGDVDLAQIESSGQKTCVIADDGEGYCWGGSVSLNAETAISSPFNVVARPTPHLTSATFGTVDGHNVLNLVGTGFPTGDDTQRLVADPLIYLNDAVVPFCNFYLGIGSDKDAFIAIYLSDLGIVVDPGLISDTSTCYNLTSIDPDTFESTELMMSTSATIVLNDSFDIEAEGTISFSGSNELTFNEADAEPEVSAVIDSEDPEDSPTVSDTPTFSGSAPEGSVVTVTVHSDPVSCTDTADSNDEWSCTIATALPAGSHTVNIEVVTPDDGTINLGPYDITVVDDDEASESGGGAEVEKDATTGGAIAQATNDETTTDDTDDSETPGLGAGTDVQYDDVEESVGANPVNWSIILGIVAGIGLLILIIVTTSRRLRRSE